LLYVLKKELRNFNFNFFFWLVNCRVINLL
jgi:hypothetical protein